MQILNLISKWKIANMMDEYTNKLWSYFFYFLKRILIHLLWTVLLEIRMTQLSVILDEKRPDICLIWGLAMKFEIDTDNWNEN
mgnify:CR=1 FL=1